ncbi:MAG: GAF domain-containing protein [Desulfomonile tiedjei]|nr:GAF domain-containing protein [Desulfomonile tiedjei]
MLPRFSIVKKFVLVFLIVSIIPLCALGVSTLWNLRAIGQGAIDNTTLQMEKRAKESLELRAVELADRVTQLLHSCEGDLFTLAMLPRTAEIYGRFSLNHRKTIWAREGTNEDPVEVHKEIPLYREIVFIGPGGMEEIRITEDRIAEAAELRDVSKPENTTYKSEKYFQETRKLKKGDLYVSHVTGWFVSRDEQLQGAGSVEEALEGKKFEGVVRIATPCFTETGKFEGIVMVSLDHRHLMELTLHILPTDERFVVFPSYSSGNYAFMFDDEGWIIAHPKFYDIRGIYPDGSECDPTAPSYTREKLLAGEVPFNLDHVDFINPNYSNMAREVRAGRSGVVSTYNVGGIPRVMAYAPIFYDRIPYNRHGVFGGMTIGVQTAKFAEPALMASAKIDDIVAQTKLNTLIILGITALAVILLGTVLARRFTQPIMYLARKARQIAEGHIPYYVAVQTGDELELLGRNFDDMATEIRRHRESLDKSFAELADSKKSVEGYSRQLETQLKVLKNVHYLSQYLTTAYDRELVLQTVLKTCVEGLGYDRAVLYLYEQDTRRLTCHQTFGFSPEHEAGVMGSSYDIDRHDCIPTKAFRFGETLLVKDVRTDPRTTPIDLDIGEAAETDCFVFTPIKSRDRVIGVLGADTNTSSREIRDVEIESLEIVANDAARAIERSELHSKLVAERNFIKSIVTSMTSGIITLDESGCVTWFNPYSEAVFKIRPEDALGNHYRDVFGAFPDWIDLIDRCLDSPECVPGALEKLSVRQDGKETVLEVHFSRIEPQKPHQSIFLIFIQDVTQRKHMEEHIRRSDRLVSLGVLAAGIAHEMRNPLTGLSLLMDDVHDHLPDGSQARDLVRRSLQEIDRLENLINGLLDFAAPSRQVNLEVRPLGDVLHKTLFLLRKLCRNHKVTLNGHADESLPLLHLDADKLQQALLNLLLNAVQAMPEGGDLTVEVKEVPALESLLSGPAVRIIVSDTGTGIAPEDIPYIFDPFFTRSPSGCGLGLAIVHGIVQEHKGRISVSSELGKGTTFQVDLPTAQEPSKEQEAMSGPAAGNSRAVMP